MKNTGPGTIWEIIRNLYAILRLPRIAAERAPLIRPTRGLGDTIHNLAERLEIGQRVRRWFAQQKRSCGCPQRQANLNAICPYRPKPFVIDATGKRTDKPFLSLGMATAGDWDGVHQTVNSILGECRAAGVLDLIEVIVVDNKPEDWQGATVRNYCETWLKRWVRYIPFTRVRGTTAPRQHVFDQARGEWVAVFDCHLSFTPGSIRKTIRYLMRHRFDRTLFGGTLDNTTASSDAPLTHLDLQWRGNMFGTWAGDERGRDIDGKPFDVPNIACWAMLCRKDAWPGFHPLAKSFGGEEGTLAVSARKRGLKVQCLPLLRAAHRFDGPGKPRQYGTPMADIVRNHALILHAVGATEELAQCRDYFASPNRPDDPTKTPLATREVGETDETFWKRNADITDAIITDAIHDHQQYAQGMHLEQLYQQAANTPSDINEHCPRLRQLASECDVVVEFGTRHAVSTVALMAGRPTRLVTYDLNGCPSCTQNSLTRAANSVAMQFEAVTANTLTMPVIEPCDMLFVDTYHTATQVRGELDRHAGQVRKILAFHDTEAPWGMTGEDGGPGVLVGITEWLGQHPEWSQAERYTNNHGLVVLRRVNSNAEDSELVGELL